MRDALIQTCHQLRVAADISQATIADKLGRDQAFISRFEQTPESGNPRWPQQLTAIVEAYADALGIPVQGIWAQAIQTWGRTEGFDEAVNYFATRRETSEEVVSSVDERLERLTAIVTALVEVIGDLDGKVNTVLADAEDRQQKMAQLLAAVVQ